MTIPESPDFDAIGSALAAEAGYSGDRVAQRVAASIAQQLRLVWNARGAADMHALEHIRAFGVNVGVEIDAIRKLDR